MRERPSGGRGIGCADRKGGTALLNDLACPVLEISASGRLRFANRAAAEQLGLTLDDLDQPLLDRLGVSLAGQLRIACRLALLVAARRPALRVWLEAKPGVDRPRSWQLTGRRDARGRLVGIIAIARQLPPLPGRRHRFSHPRERLEVIDSAAHAAERLHYLFRHDPLTGLINRQALGETLSNVLDEARRASGGVALLALDLADFKRVNDSYGHGIGDQLLQQAATRLRRSVARSDMVARLGGDEFALVVPLPNPDVAIAARIAERIAERLRQPFGIDGHEIHCGVCIGITLSPLHGRDVPTLLQQADLALHEAKRHDNGICVFGAELSAASQRRKSIENALRQALARDEMSLVLQPQFAVGNRALVGCEALLRWRHGQPDEIGPAAFVPIAEETGLIVAFGSWVLNEACRLAAGWWQGGLGPRIAVNLSPVQFWNRDLCREVEQALAAARLPPEALELEITEGVLMRDTRSAADTLNKLNELGVAIALDDFGTGYSSLSYLKKFPIHRLKIDQTFIRDLDHDDDDRQIAKAIIGLGHSLNLEVVAEGVETARHLAFLADLECDVAQGYLFSPPLMVTAFKAALQATAWPLARDECPRQGRLAVAERNGGSPVRRILRRAGSARSSWLYEKAGDRLNPGP